MLTIEQQTGNRKAMKRFSHGKLWEKVRREGLFGLRLLLAFSIAFSAIQMCRMLYHQNDAAGAQARPEQIESPARNPEDSRPEQVKDVRSSPRAWMPFPGRF